MVDLTALNANQTADLEWGRAKLNAERAAQTPPLAAITLQQYANGAFNQQVLQELRRGRIEERKADLLAQFSALSVADQLKALSVVVQS
jgi:hypothetical protein